MGKDSFIKKIVIFILAFVGLLTTIKLAFIYYDANFNPYALPSFCSVSEFIDCDGIARTGDSQFLGIPLAYWGMFFYAFVSILLFADKLKNFVLLKFLEVFKNPFDYIALLGIFSFTISMLLLGLSLFEIKKLCVLCAFTYILNLLIGLIAIDYKNGGLIKAFKQSITDFMDAVKIKKYLIMLLIVIFVATGFLTYTNTSKIFAPQVKQAQIRKSIMEFMNLKTDKYSVNGNLLGDNNAELKVYIYTDYNCPFCGAFDKMFHKAVTELKGFRVIHKHLPLDMECNKFLRSPFHEGSCRMARYAMAAEKQGKFWDMNDKLFELRPQTEEQILEIAKEINLDIKKKKKDANSDKTKEELEKTIKDSYEKGVDATPSMMINDVVVIGIKPYPELKKMLEEAGAKSR